MGRRLREPHRGPAATPGRREAPLRAFAITIAGHAASEAGYAGLVASSKAVGNPFEIERFDAVTPDRVGRLMAELGLCWAWPEHAAETDPASGLVMVPYDRGTSERRIACALSHFLLWKRCAEGGEPLLVLEHDALFRRRFDPRLALASALEIIGINDPFDATRRAATFAAVVAADRSPVQRVPWVDHREVPQGTAGASAYLVKPRGCRAVIAAAERSGLWPNDALLCRQRFDFVGVLRDPVTTVQGLVSTTTSRQRTAGVDVRGYLDRMRAKARLVRSRWRRTGGGHARAREQHAGLGAARVTPPPATPRWAGAEPDAPRPRVSVVLPTDAATEEVAASLASVLDQTTADLEILLIDDGRSPEIGALLASFAWTVRRVAAPPYLSRAAAFNLGVERARGDMVAFLVPGDVWRADKLALQLAALQEDPPAAAVLAGAVTAGPQSLASHAAPSDGTHMPPPVLGLTELLALRWPTLSTLLVRARELSIIGPVDETGQHGEQLDFLLRVAERTRLLHLPAALAQRGAHASGRRCGDHALWRDVILALERRACMPLPLVAWPALRETLAAARLELALAALASRDEGVRPGRLLLGAAWVDPLVLTRSYGARTVARAVERVALGAARGALGLSIGPDERARLAGIEP